MLKEIEYFGYLIHVKIIKDEDIIVFYKPRIIEMFNELNLAGFGMLKRMEYTDKV